MVALGIFALKELYGRDRELIRELKTVVQDNTKAMQAIDKRVSRLEWHAGIDAEDTGT